MRSVSAGSVSAKLRSRCGGVDRRRHRPYGRAGSTSAADLPYRANHHVEEIRPMGLPTLALVGAAVLTTTLIAVLSPVQGERPSLTPPARFASNDVIHAYGRVLTPFASPPSW